MSRHGNCHHNTVMESWFASVTSEEGEHFHSYEHARALLFDYLPRGVQGGEAGWTMESWRPRAVRLF